MKRRHLKFYFFVIALSCLFTPAVFARGSQDTLDSKIGGLKFLSKQVFASERTTLSLFPDCKKFNANIELSFDCSIYNTQRFGYVFRIIDCEEETEKPYLHLRYHYETHHPDTFRLELYSPVTNTKIDFNLASKRSFFLEKAGSFSGR